MSKQLDFYKKHFFTAFDSNSVKELTLHVSDSRYLSLIYLPGSQEVCTHSRNKIESELQLKHLIEAELGLPTKYFYPYRSNFFLKYVELFIEQSKTQEVFPMQVLQEAIKLYNVHPNSDNINVKMLDLVEYWSKHLEYLKLIASKHPLKIYK